MALKIGCCGFRSARQRYFTDFSLVEVQHTFYDPPKIETLKKWRAEAPKNFEFSLKAYQLITHRGDSPTYRRIKKPIPEESLIECGHFLPTKTVFDAYKLTLECAEALDAKLLLFQCPARFTPEEENVENLINFFKTVKRPSGVKFVWEPRGRWPEALISDLCRDLNLYHAVDPFKSTSLTPELRYYRLHGRGRPNQRYKESELKELAETVESDTDTYVLFNNVYMLEDARTFQLLARKSGLLD